MKIACIGDDFTGSSDRHGLVTIDDPQERRRGLISSVGVVCIFAPKLECIGSGVAVGTG